MQPHWVPPTEVRARLGRLASLSDLQAVDVQLAQESGSLPLELAHDRWLRQQPALVAAIDAAMEAANRAAAAVDETAGTAGVGGEPIAPGAMAAIRRVAPLRNGRALSGWLLEPVHFHLAKDHVVLTAGAAQSLTTAEAQQLAQALEPLLTQESMALTVLSNELWVLDPRDKPLQLTCAASEAAAGRNIDGYLPVGADARRYRRLLNEIQMTWHEHPVNEQRERQGRVAINGVWLSGPVTTPVLDGWDTVVGQELYEVEGALLDARLHDDRHAWLDALQTLDARLHDWLTAENPPSILLCGEDEARWLLRRPGGDGAGRARDWAALLRSGARRLSRRVAGLRARTGGSSDGTGSSNGSVSSAGGSHAERTSSDPLVQIFTELQ